jgi:Porin subfamily
MELNQPGCRRLTNTRTGLRRDMALDCRLTFTLTACALVVGSTNFASAEGSRGNGGEHKINRCSIYGSDFVQIEGTETCARVGGHIRVELGVGNGMRNGFSRSDSDGARPAALSSGSSGQNAPDPGYDGPGDSRGHLRVRELPGARDLFAR